MTITTISIIFTTGLIAGAGAALAAAWVRHLLDKPVPQPPGETPICDAIRPSLVTIQAEAITRKAAADREWAAIMRATDGGNAA